MISFWLQIILTLTGFLGVFISLLSLPGIFLVFLTTLIVGLASNFSIISVKTLIIAGIITLLSLLLDNIAILFGAKKFGASKHGIIGAFVGSVIGAVTLNPLGIIIGAFLGAIVGEFMGNPHFESALKAGIGTFFGYLVGVLLKFIVTAALFVWALTVIW